MATGGFTQNTSERNYKVQHKPMQQPVVTRASDTLTGSLYNHNADVPKASTVAAVLQEAQRAQRKGCTLLLCHTTLATSWLGLRGRTGRKNQAAALAFVPPTPVNSQNDSSTFDFNKDHIYINITTYSINILNENRGDYIMLKRRRKAWSFPASSRGIHIQNSNSGQIKTCILKHNKW